MKYSIKMIKLQHHIANLVKACDPDNKTIDGFYDNTFYSTTLPLSRSRLARVQEALEQGVELPLVKLRKLPSGLYEILDGRHRITAAILRGQNEIDAVEVN